MRGMRALTPPTYLLPRENATDFDELFAVWRRLDRSELAHERTPLDPGGRVKLRQDLDLLAFRSPHRVPTLGYALLEQRSKLLPEFAALGSDELRRRRERGEAITELRETPLVAFPGDTRIDVVEREEVVRRAKLLILEVTFLDDRVSVADARAMGHVHLDEVCARADLFENEALLFTHASRRYRPGEIPRLLERRLPRGLADRVVSLHP